MTITVVGSGTVVPTLARASSSYWVEHRGETVCFDFGSGSLRRMLEHGLEPWNLDNLVISHIHPDHTADLVPFLFALNYAPEPWKRERPLRLVAPTGFRTFLDRLGKAWEWVEPKGFELRLEEVDDQKILLAGEALSVYRVEHGGLEARAYRFGSFCYSGDTKPCRGLSLAAEGAELLLCECALSASMERRGDHMKSDEVGRLAQEAGVGRLVLTHLYPQLEVETLLEEARSHFQGPVEAARDGAVYTLAG